MADHTRFLAGKKSTVIVLFHAYTGNTADVRLLGEFLHREGYPVYLPLLAGHGTDYPLDVLTKGSLSAWLVTIDKTQRFLKQQGYERVVWGGLSLGSLLALTKLTTQSQEMPQSVGGILLGCPVYGLQKKALVAAFKHYMNTSLLNLHVSSAQQLKADDYIRNLLPAQLDQIEAVRLQVQQKLADIEVPLFIGQGTADQLVSTAGVHELVTNITSAPITLQVYTGAGHAITVNQAHHRLQEDIKNYLEKCEELNV